MTDSNILIKNIYYMLAYAFKVLKQTNYSKIEIEKFENVHNLFAAILSKGISQQLKQGLYREYVGFEENLKVLRGKMEMNGSIKNRLQNKQCLTCQYDELSENNIFNQILKLTATILIRNKHVDLKYKSELKRLMLYFGGVKEISISEIRWSTLRFQRNNQSYKMLMNICWLILDGLLISSKQGACQLADFLDDQHMSNLYERFIREYYRYHYGNYIRVESSYVDWDVIGNPVGIELLPKMKTDIILQVKEKTIIIDAKYYNQNMQHYFGTNKFHSANMYQIYTYVKNYDNKQTGNVSGVLLYARTTEEIQPNNSYIISGNEISIKTIDLNSDFEIISKQLNEIVKPLLVEQ